MLRFPLRFVPPTARLLVLLTEAVLPVSRRTVPFMALALVRVIVPAVPALKIESAPAAVVVMVEPANWLIDPPVALASIRLELTVGRTTLPAVALNTDGPPVVT